MNQPAAPSPSTPASTPAPSPAAVAANSQGMAALGRGDAVAAAAHFRAAIAADPGAGALHRNLATACRALGDEAAELAALDAALALDQRDLMARIRKAEWHERHDQPAEAYAAYAAVAALGQQIADPPPPLAALLAHANAYVTAATADIAATVDTLLADARADLDETSARRTAAFVDMALRGRPRFQNECAGLYYPFLPADEFFDRRHFPWFDAFEAQTDAIRAEALALLDDPGEALRPYVRMEAGTPASKWTALDNRLDWGACFLWEYGRPNQAVLDRCPATAAALAAIPAAHIPDRSPSAFFSILRGGAHIPPHTGVTNSRAIVHLPLVVPPGCGFRVGGETREWVEGTAFAFDDSIDHEAWNNSDQIRIILITDVWNPHLSAAEQAFITRYFAAADSSSFAIRR